METIERPPTSDADRVTSLLDIPPAPVRPRTWTYRLWRGSVAFLTIASVSFGISALVALRNLAAVGWQNAFAEFKWAVPVTGDQIELDEIGRYLKQLDHVSDVTLLPSGAIMDRLRAEPLLANHLSALDPAQLPSLWQVTWLPGFDFATTDDVIADLRRLPGIIDVAFEQREIDKIFLFRGQWLKVRLVLSTLVVLGALLGSLLLGRFLFFTRLSALKSARLWEIALISCIAWIAGLALAWNVVGPFNGHLAWGGIGAAIARLAATHTRRAE